MTSTTTRPVAPSQTRHLLIELGPSLGFFAVYQFSDIWAATAALMVMTIASLCFGWFVERRLPALPAVTCLLVLLLGGLSFLFNDETFIKIKPTIGKLLFAGILAASILLKRPLPRHALTPLLNLTEAGWRILSWRWVFVALAFAVAYEIAWRHLSTEDWVTTKLIMGPLGIGVFYLVTRLTAYRHWDNEV